MLVLKLKKMTVGFDFSFFAVIFFYFYMKNEDGGTALAALAACGLHELCHLAAMAALRIRADSIIFRGGGICICSRALDGAKFSARAAVLGAGCAGNFAAAGIFFMSGDAAAAAVNILMGGFNLLALGELDGAKLLEMLAIKFARPENVGRIVGVSGFVSAAFFAAALAAFDFPPFAAIFAVYLLVMSAAM